MPDGALHSAGGGLEGLGHLGVEYLGNGVDHIHIIDGNDDGLPQVLIALDMGRDTNGVCWYVCGIYALVFIKLYLL